MAHEKEKRDIADGIIFISGEINQGTAESVCRDVIRVNTEMQAPLIQFIINSNGGYCSAGFAITDIMEWSRVPVYTTGIGMIASMGLLIFMAGEKGHRIVTPRTSILSHRYYGQAAGNHSELVARRKEEDLMHQRIVNHYLQHSKIQSEEELNRTLLRDVDTWLSPQEAVGYGLVDTVEIDRKRKYPNWPARAER